MTSFMQSGNSIEQSFMKLALDEARKAYQDGDVPVGAVIATNRRIVAYGRNMMRLLPDPTAHAEIIAIRNAVQTIGELRLPECDIYVTLEPCLMCAQAISLARLRRVYFGAHDYKAGAIGGACFAYGLKGAFHIPETYQGIMEQECQQLLKDFFAGVRQ